MDDRTVRLALQRHWDASDANDFETEHEIYREDAVLDYPQSGERIRGRLLAEALTLVRSHARAWGLRNHTGENRWPRLIAIHTVRGLPNMAAWKGFK